MEVKIELTNDQIDSIAKQIRGSGEADSRFDINLMEGKLSEAELANIIQKCEVKKDFAAHKTGNIFIEYQSRGNKSGISTTEADWWAYILADENHDEDIILLCRTEKLKDLCRDYLDTDKNVRGGDDLTSRGIILPVKDLINKYIKE